MALRKKANGPLGICFSGFLFTFHFPFPFRNLLREIVFIGLTTLGLVGLLGLLFPSHPSLLVVANPSKAHGLFGLQQLALFGVSGWVFGRGYVLWLFLFGRFSIFFLFSLGISVSWFGLVF